MLGCGQARPLSGWHLDSGEIGFGKLTLTSMPWPAAAFPGRPAGNQEEPDQGVRRGRGVHPTFGRGTAALWGRLAARQPAGRVALGPTGLKKEGKL